MAESSLTPAAGAVLTLDQVQAILVQPLTAASVFLAAGPRIFDVTWRWSSAPSSCHHGWGSHGVCSRSG